MSKKKAKSQIPTHKTADRPAPAAARANKKDLPALLILLAFTFLIFSPALKFGFVNWDDDQNVYENLLVKEFDLQAIFTQNVIGNYNPLSILSFALEYQAFGMDPKMMHLTNLLLHLLCTFFVFRFFRLMKLDLGFALFGTALFAFHPLRVESVAWITERKDVLYGVFFTSALYLYTLNLDAPKRWRSILVFLLFGIGLFAKIQMVALPLALLAVDYFKDRPLSMKLVWEKAHYFILAFLFGCLGIFFLKEQGSFETNEMIHSGFVRIFIGSYSLLTYLIKWLVPYRMSPLYPYPEALTIWHYLSLPAALLLFGGMYWAYKKQMKALVFGFLFFFFNIVFLLQILGAGQGYLADRFTYIAYIGLFFVSAWYAQQFSEAQKQSMSVYAFSFVYVLAMAYLSYSQTLIWKNSGTLWTHVLSYYNNTSLPYNNRANYYRDNKQFDLALQDYNQAVRYKAGHSTYNSRAKLFFIKNEDEKAIADYNIAIQMHPRAEYYVNRGAAKAKLGRVQEAMADFNKGLELDPNWKVGYLNRSILYNQNGQFDPALQDINTYLKFDPGNADLWYEGGRCLRALNKPEQAVEYYSKAIRLNPKMGLFYLERGKTYQSLGNAAAAQQDFQQASRLGESIQ